MLVQSEIDIMNIGKGVALNRGLKLIKQLIRVLGCILERHIRQRVDLFVCFCCFTSQANSYGHCGTVSSPKHTFSWAGLNKQFKPAQVKVCLELRLTRCSADLCQAMVALQLRSSF